MDIIDNETYTEHINKLKSAGKSDTNESMQQYAKEWAKRIRKGKKHNDMTEKELTSMLQHTMMNPYQNYADFFYHEDLRKEVKRTRHFLSQHFKKAICMKDQSKINDIVHNIRQAFEINSFMAKLHAQNNLSIQNYIHGSETLCKQTIITFVASFNGIANLIKLVNKGIHETKNYDHDQFRLSIVILKHFFAYTNILKKIVTTRSIFESFCQLWINTVNWNKKVLYGRNQGAIFPNLLPNDKYEMELLLLELSCLFLRTSYCWLTPSYNTHIIEAMHKNNLLEITCEWLEERTKNWDHNRVMILQALSIKKSDNKYQKICHQTNYIFQCLINAIQFTQLRNINGFRKSLSDQEFKKFVQTAKDISKMMVENNLSGAMMQSCLSNVNIRSPDGEINEAFPGIKFHHLKKMRVQWKYKFLECQSSKCNVTFNKDKQSKLKKCKSCRLTFYCSRNCQKFDWKYKHRLECIRLR